LFPWIEVPGVWKLTTQFYLAPRVRMSGAMIFFPLHTFMIWKGTNLLLRLIYTYHAVPMPFPCRSAKCLDCVFPIWFTQCGRVRFTHAMPFPCHTTTMPFRKLPLKATSQRGMRTAWERHGMCELGSAGYRRHVGDLPKLGFFRLPRGVPRRLLPAAD
jgi:hypothetical protein